MLKDTAAIDWIVSSDPTQLKHINENGYNIAYWSRKLPDMKQLLQQMLFIPVLKLDVLCSYKSASKILKKHLEAIYKKSLPEEMKLLLDDVKQLSRLFYSITRSETIRLYFAVVDNDMCRKFHTDINDIRLLCTYHGPGTVCLRNKEITEAVLDQAVQKPEVIPEDSLFRAETGDVLLLKGALHPHSGGDAVLHRSPVLSESKEKRILLRLDTDTFSFQ